MPKKKEVKAIAGIRLTVESELREWRGYNDTVCIKYKLLTAARLNQITALYADTRTGMVSDIEAWQVDIVKQSIVSWDGVENERGEPCEITQQYVKALPPSIFNEIFSANTVREAQDKSPLPV
jgi:hypothetical protein